tara:strand:- start:6040 stop:6222 length:183 start_codon:yes stop_codon:yes gene_type:complete
MVIADNGLMAVGVLAGAIVVFAAAAFVLNRRRGADTEFLRDIHADIAAAEEAAAAKAKKP